MGDWRLFFLYRERLKKVTLADVQRVAEHYLKPANRVLGEFVPTDAPDRAAIPPSQEWQAALEAYKGGFPDLRHEIVSAVETPDSIAVELRITMTHTGVFATPMGELPPTGNTVVLEACDVVLLANAQYNLYATDRYTVAYKVHNAIAGLPRVKPFKITAPADNLTSCPNE